MFASATTGDRPNNSKFSQCSIGNITQVSSIWSQSHGTHVTLLLSIKGIHQVCVLHSGCILVRCCTPFCKHCMGRRTALWRVRRRSVAIPLWRVMNSVIVDLLPSVIKRITAAILKSQTNAASSRLVHSAGVFFISVTTWIICINNFLIIFHSKLFLWFSFCADIVEYVIMQKITYNEYAVVIGMICWFAVQVKAPAAHTAVLKWQQENTWCVRQKQNAARNHSANILFHRIWLYANKHKNWLSYEYLLLAVLLFYYMLFLLL